MKETIKTIMDWHEQTFPDATLDGQIVKYNEELKEFVATDYKDITELADLFIVACGIARFDMHQGLFYFADVYDWYNADIELSPETLQAAVDKKMEKNRMREWGKTAEGTYHHTNKE